MFEVGNRMFFKFECFRKSGDFEQKKEKPHNHNRISLLFSFLLFSSLLSSPLLSSPLLSSPLLSSSVLSSLVSRFAFSRLSSCLLLSFFSVSVCLSPCVVLCCCCCCCCGVCCVCGVCVCVWLWRVAARGAGTHGDVLNLHTGAFWTDTRGGGRGEEGEGEGSWVTVSSAHRNLWHGLETFSCMHICSCKLSPMFLKKTEAPSNDHLSQQNLARHDRMCLKSGGCPDTAASGRFGPGSTPMSTRTVVAHELV